MRAAKIDKTHLALVLALRQCGWLVLDTHTLPGFVDAVGYHPRHGLTLFEFKATEKSPLTKGQARLIELGWPVQVLWSVDQAIALTVQRG